MIHAFSSSKYIHRIHQIKEKITFFIAECGLDFFCILEFLHTICIVKFAEKSNGEKVN